MMPKSFKTLNYEIPMPTTVTNASLSSVTSLSVMHSTQSRNVNGVGADRTEESKSSGFPIRSIKSIKVTNGKISEQLIHIKRLLYNK